MLITERNQDLSMDISGMFLPDLSSADDTFSFDDVQSQGNSSSAASNTYWSNLNMDCPLPPEDDFLQQLSNDLEIPMLLDDSSQQMLNDSTDDLMQDGSLHNDLLDPYPSLDELGDVEAMHWGPEAFPNLAPLPDDPDCEIKDEIKIEPGSPLALLPPSPSPSSSSSSDAWTGGESLSEVKFVLETPPISPQLSDGSPPGSPYPNNKSGDKHQDSIVMMSPVKIVPVTKNGIKTGGGTKILITQQAVNSTKSIKIQPKPEPGANSALPVVSVPKINKESRTIVLTAQDFAALARQVKSPSNGINKGPPTVRIQAVPPKQSQLQTETLANVQTQSKLTTASVTIPVQQPAVNNTVPILKKSITTTVTSIPAAPVVTTTVPAVKCVSQPIPGRQELEMKAIKRQQRMIKNRESACLSRKKKKEYVTALENQISELQQENVQLKLENIALKERLSLYEENSTWKRPGVLNGNIRKTTAVLAVLFMVSFNIGSLGGLFHQGPDPLGELQGSPASQKLPSFRHGRSLLWSDMDRRNFPSVEDPFSDVNPISNTSNIHATCPMFINQTESIRLDSELRRWIGVDLESENLTQEPKPEVKSLGELLLPVPTTKPQSHKFKPKTKRKQQISRRQPAVSNEVEVYGIRPQYYNYAAFFEAIHRRDDTFYVVSFSGDHLLVPALAHNKTVRPKMSLVLPALPFNESMTAPPNHVTMMQIDCEVTNTQLLHVKKGDIPAHLRQNDTGHYSNSTASDKPSTKDQADDDFTSERRPAMTRSQPYRPYFVKPNHKKFMDNGEFPSEPKISVEFGSSNPYNITSNRMSNLSNVLSSKDYMKKDPRFT